MPHTTGYGLTLATCCYCGAQGALCLKAAAKSAAQRGGPRELACQSCGAPLRRLKAVKTPAPAPEPRRSPAKSKPSKVKNGKKPDRRRPKRRAPPLVSRLYDWVDDVFDDALDVIEDIID